MPAHVLRFIVSSVFFCESPHKNSKFEKLDKSYPDSLHKSYGTTGGYFWMEASCEGYLFSGVGSPGTPAWNTAGGSKPIFIDFLTTYSERQNIESTCSRRKGKAAESPSTVHGMTVNYDGEMKNLLNKLRLFFTKGARLIGAKEDLVKLHEQVSMKSRRIKELEGMLCARNRRIAELDVTVKTLIAEKNTLSKAAAAQPTQKKALSSHETSNAFHRLYYNSLGWARNTYLGFPILQCPMDLQLYQELVFRLRPHSIIQTGVAGGGSLLYFATLLDLIQMDPDCLVIGIDLHLSPEALALKHPRIRLIEGSSIAPETIRAIEPLLPEEGSMISLDSDHTAAYVVQEIRLYSRYVAVGSYLVVEDTNINGHPVLPNFGPGPFEAVDDFLEEDSRFVRDNELSECNCLSFHQHGWLKRTH